MNRRVFKPELLLPAGSPELLRTAIRYGADAVYLGGEAFSLRAGAKNFTMEEIREGAAFAHAHGCRVYITANIFAHNDDLPGLRSFFRELSSSGADAVLISDPGVFLLAREEMPGMPIHISTQANNTNYQTFLFWYAQGVRRIVCARELSLRELSEIRERIPEDMEMEAFVHGSMCMAYSGRCLLSNFLAERDANRGACTHPCRWHYALMEEKRPGEYFPIEEEEGKGTYILNSKDLCMISHIPELLEAGISSFKVEGRMKAALYVATVARAYRLAIDEWNESPETYYERRDWYRKEVAACTYRPYGTGFYFGKPSGDGQIYEGLSYVSGSTYYGTASVSCGACGDRSFFLTQKNKFSVGDTLCVMKPDGRDLPAEVLEIKDAESGLRQDSCPHAGQRLRVRMTVCPEAGDVLRSPS